MRKYILHRIYENLASINILYVLHLSTWLLLITEAFTRWSNKRSHPLINLSKWALDGVFTN